ncbi:MAG: TonB-dependent receptor domain-containing protein, partial [Terriglobia bacterium]
TFDNATSRQAGDTFAFARGLQTRQQYLTLVGSHIFSPSVLASSRLGYTRPVDDQESVSSIEIPRSLFFVPDVPQFGQINIPGAGTFGPVSFLPAGSVTNAFQFSGDIIAQQEKHGLKFGVEVHRYRWDIFSSSAQGGEWAFNSLDSFLQGGPEGTSLTVALPGSSNKKAFRQTLVGLYGQDEYKIRSNLQLSLGFRYEFTTLLRDRYGRDSFLADPLRSTDVQVGPVLPNNPSLRNFSPRLGLAWSPGGGNTTVNAGFGIYYDHLMAFPFDILKSGLPFYRIAVLPNFNSSAIFPDALRAAREVGFPLQAQNLDYQNIDSPAMLRYNLTLQQRLPGDSNVQVGYVGARGNHLLRNYEANLFPVPIRQPDGSLFFPPNAGPVNPAFQGGINLMSSDAQSFYNALLISADTRPSQALSLRATYTYSKSVDDSSAFNFRGTQQFGLLRTLDRGLSDFDIRHRVTVNFFYTLPAATLGSGPFSQVLSKLLGSWRVGGIAGFRSGVPATALINVRRPGYLFAATRPNLLPGQTNNPTQGVSIGCNDPVTGARAVEAGRELGGPNLLFDPCVFGVPAAGTLGNLGRNTLIGPSVFNVDVSLQREFSLGNSRRLQFRAEFFNLTNHPNFRTPSSGSLLVFAGSGRFNPTAVHATGTATTSRQTQFALRFSF